VPLEQLRYGRSRGLFREPDPAGESGLSEPFESIRPTILTPMEEATLVDLYLRIPASSFSD